jgi:Carboxypeptidase regulatory-like domain/TonB-dependent Receptor Plug Domain
MKAEDLGFWNHAIFLNSAVLEGGLCSRASKFAALRALMHDRLAAVFVVLSSIFFSSIFLHAGEIRGKVVSVDRGEALARVQVAVLVEGQREAVTAAVTANDGSFVLQNLNPGHYTLRLNAVGYRLITVEFSLAADEAATEFDVTLVPDNFRRTEKVEVKGDIFQGPDSPAINELNLTSTEIRETSTVVADDPFRAIQSLPGVSASGGNDFFAQFSVMGASYANTSIYLDGILVPSPFHGTDITQGATLSIFTSETLEDVKLLPAAYPEKYGDSVGAALDLQTRDGSRTTPTFRASIGLADSELLGEGEIGKEKKGSWIASARKSYLGYLLRNRLNDTSDNISFYDGDLKLTYDVAANQTVSFYGVGGHTLYELINPSQPLTPESVQRATNDFMMGRVGWRWTVNPHLLVETRAAYFQAPFYYRNPSDQPLDNDHYAEWVTGGSVVWNWQKDHVLESGWTTRRAGTSDEFTNYNPDGTVQGTGSQSVVGWKNDGYVQQSSSFFGNRLHLVGGLRLDSTQQFDFHPISPQLGASLQVASATELQFGVGRYNQFEFPAYPPFQLPNGCAVGFESYQTANHYTAGVEQRIGESTRVKVLLFDRQNATSYRDSLYDPITGTCISTGGFVNQERDYSRGAQIVLQSRTANRLSGWIGYTLAYSRESIPFGYIQIQVPTDEDQRHTLNVFASYRINPTVHISGKFLFGSGFPIPLLQFNSNAVRLGDYQRLDVRAEKDWAFTHWKLALYGEVLNLTDHNNPRYFYTSYNPTTGTSTVVTGQGLPITPTAGLAFEF